MRNRTNPLDDQIGLGGKHPLLRLLAVWVLGFAVIIGLSYILPRQTEGIVAGLIVLALLMTVRI